MQMYRERVVLAPKRRGVHLVTDEIMSRLPQIGRFETGLLHLFLRHTSAALTINENADPSVRFDMERFLDATIPDGWRGFSHTLEGDDDMPAHLKSSLLGCQLTLPIANGKPSLGTWQGVYLVEAREHGGPREITATLFGSVM